MHLGAAGLNEQPFRVHGRPVKYVSYEAQEAAHEFLRRVCRQQTGLGLFQGPGLSGKTTILHSFVESLGDDIDVAYIDGTGLSRKAFLERVLNQYGFRLEFNSVGELLNMLKVFVLQRAAHAEPPILIIENTHALNPSALRTVCELAELRVHNFAALKMILASDRSIEAIVRSPAMRGTANRLTGLFRLRPLTEYETMDYLYDKLRAGGCNDPENVIPEEVCDELYAASGGWPGILDRLVLLALAKADRCPMTMAHIEHPALPEFDGSVGPAEIQSANGSVVLEHTPRLYLTRNGKTTKEVMFEQNRLIIGRSEHNDIRIEHKLVSRHHALFIRHGATTLLMDLNSTNGTFVNSTRVSNKVMRHNDVISIGNHRIKFVHPGAETKISLDNTDAADTIIMKSLDDMRNVLAKENTHLVAVVSDQDIGVADRPRA